MTASSSRVFSSLNNEGHRFFIDFWLSSKTSVALALLGLSVVLVLYRLFFHPLARIPGPFIARFSGLWRQYRYWTGTWHDDILWLHDTYGHVVRVAPNEVSVVDAHAVKKLYSHGTKAEKTKWYDTWEKAGAEAGVFSVQDKGVHSSLRKRISSVYSMSSLLKYETYIQGCLDVLMEHLMNRAVRGQVVDMTTWTSAFAFDVVGELAYGEEFGHLRTESDVDNLRSKILNAFYLIANVGHLPGQMGLLNNRLTDFVCRLLGLENPSNAFISWTREKIRHRWENKESSHREDMLTHFMNMKNDTGGPAGLEEIVQEAAAIIGAGADTTAIGMRSCLYYICKHPSVYHRLQKEIDDFYTMNALRGPVTYLQTQQMAYLQAVVKEATRIFPSISYQLLRYCPEGGLTIDSKFIPAGTPIGVSPLAQNHDVAVWGMDAHHFKPERWLDDPAHVRLLESVNMTFGGNGPRACIGKNIALIEIHKFLAQMIRTFDIELVDKEKPWRVTSSWFAYQHEIIMKLTPRVERERNGELKITDEIDS